MTEPTALDRFFHEVARRRLFHAAGVYAVASWFFVQAVATMAPYAGLPDWTLRLVTTLVVLGLPIVLGLAWIFAGRGDGTATGVAGGPGAGADVPGLERGPADAGRGPSRSSARSTRSDLALIVGLFVVGAAFWAYRTYIMEPRAEAAGRLVEEIEAGTAVRSVAVLPFENVGGDPENEYFSRGVSEEIRSVLAQVPGLRVPSRISSFRYAPGSRSLAEIAEELGVETVLDGSVRRAGDRVRVTVELVDARGDVQLWAETYDRALTVEDLFTVEDQIARSVAQALELELTGGTAGQPARARPVSLETHDLYLLGLYHWNRRTGPELQKAVELFTEAVEREPDYALAHAGLANTYLLLPLYAGAPAADAMPMARQAAQRALALDNGLAEAHAALAFVRTTYDWDWAGAEQAFLRAISLDPAYATAHQWYGLLLDALGRHDDAHRRIGQAVELDPLSPIINEVLANHYMWTGEHDRAIEQLHRTLALHEDFPLALQFLAQTYLQSGLYDEARDALRRWAELTGNDPAAWDPVIAGVEGSGERAVAVEAVRAMEDGGVLGTYRAAEYYAMLGATDPALDALENALARREFLMFLVAIDPALTGLREEGRYRQILDDMGLTRGAAGS